MGQEPEFNIVRQNQEMLAAEGVDLVIEEDAVHEIARIATELNQNLQNIGARRLHTVTEKVLEEISYSADQYRGQTVTITAADVRTALGEMLSVKIVQAHSLNLNGLQRRAPCVPTQQDRWHTVAKQDDKPFRVWSRLLTSR